MKPVRLVHRLLALPAYAPLAVLVVGIAHAVIARRVQNADMAVAGVEPIARELPPVVSLQRVIIVGVVCVAALVLYLPLMLRAARPPAASSCKWLALRVLGGPVTMPVYWYFHVWRDDTAVD